MKKKIISFLLACFLFVSSSISSFAYDKTSRALPMITPQMLGVISTIAVGSGIVLNNADDIIDLGRGFYEYHKEQWELVSLAFNGALTMMSNGKVNCSSDVVNNVRDFLDAYFGNALPGEDIYFASDLSSLNFKNLQDIPFGTSSSGGICINFNESGSYFFRLYINDGSVYAPSKGKVEYHLQSVIGSSSGSLTLGAPSYGYIRVKGGVVEWLGDKSVGSRDLSKYLEMSSVVSIPYTGGFSWDKIGQVENEDLPLYIPQDLSDLLNKDTSDVLNGNYDLLTDGTVSFPQVDNPSINIGGVTDIPLDGVLNPPSDVPGDTPSDTVFDKIKDFIIGLVVPSDTFWTDTFGGLRGSFEEAFPMLDMSSFESLIVGGKPFPNIDVDVMGVRGRVVDGDVINSIVDWLRPLIAGFIMLCLMFFNYRKIYKLIRNTEPFGNIAPGSSDFRTGLSAPGMSEPSNYEIARDQIRDLAFEMRNEILHRKHNGGV